VVACATNLLSASAVCATSAKTSSEGAVPGSELVPQSGGTPSSISPGGASYPWGTTFTIGHGTWGTENSPGTAASPFSYSYEWKRCDSVPKCTVIPGATDATYTTTAADVDDSLVGYVSAQQLVARTRRRSTRLTRHSRSSRRRP
jgi:hypothetical protein